MTKYSLFKADTPKHILKEYRRIGVIKCAYDEIFRIPNQWSSASQRYILVYNVPEEDLTMCSLQGWYIRNVAMDEFHIKLLVFLE